MKPSIAFLSNGCADKEREEIAASLSDLGNVTAKACFGTSLIIIHTSDGSLALARQVLERLPDRRILVIMTSEQGGKAREDLFKNGPSRISIVDSGNGGMCHEAELLLDIIGKEPRYVPKACQCGDQ